MCGRYSNSRASEDLGAYYEAQISELIGDWSGAFSIPPTDPAPVVRERIADDGERIREVGEARWGLRPHWLDDKRPGFHNARLETVAEKPAFRQAFAKRRILVPMDGYYEWVPIASRKQPYFIHAVDGGQLTAAGLLEFARRGEDDWLVTFTIITRTARDASGEVHDRMPVFLTADAFGEWADPDPLDKVGAGRVLNLLHDSSDTIAETLTTRPVSTKLNNVRTVDPRDASLVDAIDL